MHFCLDFLTKLQNKNRFPLHTADPTNTEYKVLDAVVPDQLLTVNANTSSYQIEEYKNSSLVVILHCLNTKTTLHFHYL